MASNKKRVYHEKLLNYGFTQIEDKGIMKPQCVVCLKVLTAESFKQSQLKKHLDNLHSHLSSKPREYFVNLEKSTKRQRLDSNLRVTFDQCSAAEASFEVAWLIARYKKPHTIGQELIKPAALKMAEIMCVLAKNVREQVISSIKESKYFTFQLDETTDISNNAQLMVYIRTHAIEEELLFCSPLELRSPGIDVFNKVNEYFNTPSINLKWKDCIAVTVDGAPAMLGNLNGFSALVKSNNLEIEITHCMIHHQALLKHLEPVLESIIHDVIKVVNFVRQHALNTRLFRELCEDGEAEYTDLLYYTEVRWFSHGNVLNRVWALKTELEIFLTDQKHILADKFINTLWVAHLAYLTDVFEHVNALNKELQGKNIKIISAREKISAFGSKLLYWRQKIQGNKIAAFPKERFSNYFPDFDISTISWVVDPFKCEIAEIPEEPQGLTEAILELRSNNEARIEFENKTSLSSFWMTTAAKAFNTAHKEALKRLLPFATTYLCEQGNCLNCENDIQIALTFKTPNYYLITEEQLQRQTAVTVLLH
uniref:DUF4371 domain-containing protein n=1 Tax=Erpetoichthys calabaricus TaxID=27687 RepID=A0A8C4SQ16_ERPCA